MKKVGMELKNCPNCNERIGIQDVECPYCKYIDDPKYKKYNEKLKKGKINKKKTKKSSKNDIYKILLLIPIISYLIYLMFNFESVLLVVIALILFNVLCFFMKKIFSLYAIIIEIIALLFNFIVNIYEMSLGNSYNGINRELIILILGIVFVIVPKFIYLSKTKKKGKKE